MSEPVDEPVNGPVAMPHCSDSVRAVSDSAGSLVKTLRRWQRQRLWNQTFIVPSELFRTSGNESASKTAPRDCCIEHR